MKGGTVVGWRSGVLALAASMALAGTSVVFAAGEEVVIYKDPACGCCGKWARHLEAAGFKVREVPTSLMDQVKREAGVPRTLGSCHTAKVGRYVIEGHVPAADITRLLAEQREVTGLSAPGMPQGSPGMEGPYPPDRYEVVSFTRDGRFEVFARH